MQDVDFQDAVIDAILEQLIPMRSLSVNSVVKHLVEPIHMYASDKSAARKLPVDAIVSKRKSSDYEELHELDPPPPEHFFRLLLGAIVPWMDQGTSSISRS